MEELAITTCVYKYNRFANGLLILYCIAALGLFIFSSYMSEFFVIVYCIILFGLPIYTGIFPRSVFSIRSWETRPLIISENNIHLGEEVYDIREVENLCLYIYSFNNFSHKETGSGGTRSHRLEGGDQNTLSFDFNNKKYAFTFYLSDYAHYKKLYHIVGSWQRNLIPVNARSFFNAGYIRERMLNYGL